MKKIIFLTPSALYYKHFLTSNSLLFDEELKAAQEWEFICRVLFYSKDYITIDTPLVYIRKHKESKTYNNDDLNRELQYLQARIKVFHFLKSNKRILKDSELTPFFKDYFLKKFKKLLFYDRKQAMELYNNSLKHFHSFFLKIKTKTYIKFVLYTGKGYNYRSRFIK